MSLRRHFLPRDAAEGVAASLEAAGAVKCAEHGWSPSCPLCGVRCVIKRWEDRVWWDGDVQHVEMVLEKRGPWTVIPWEERVAWAERVDALTEKGRKG